MQEHRDSFDDAVTQAEKVMSSEQSDAVNNRFLGGLFALLLNSDDGKISSEDIVKVYKNTVKTEIKNMEWKNKE